MPLYPAQKVIAEKLLNIYSRPNYYRQQRLYLSGEMGVGKTYMASAVIARLMRDRPIILVVPPNIITKWRKVLNEYASDYKLKLFNDKTCLNDPKILLKKNQVNLIPNRNFNRLFTYESKDIHNLNFSRKLSKALGKKVSPQVARHSVGITNYQRVIHTDPAPLVVYDEIHQVSKSKLRCFSKIMENSKCYGLFLTGTIFNMSLNSVSRLIQVTHPRLYNYVDIDWQDLQITSFMREVWQYISLSLSVHQVRKSMHTKKIKLDVIPIKPVAIDNEELAFYKFAFIQLKELGKKPKVAKLMASNFLDYPQRPPEITIKNSAGPNRVRRHTLDAVAMPLMDMNLSHTKKYKTLLKYMSRYSQGKRTIIYVNDHSLIKTLTSQLNRDGYNAKHLQGKLKSDQYSTFINKSFKNGTNVFVVDPHQVNVGVDIHADVLIWYQLLLNMGDIIQAQHRIHRLSSKHNSKVIFLPYRLTYQEQLVDQISNASKFNAASYGVQERNNLAKFTGVLLNAIGQ